MESLKCLFVCGTENEGVIEFVGGGGGRNAVNI